MQPCARNPVRVDLACGPTRVLRSIHEEQAVFPAPSSSDQRARAAALGSRTDVREARAQLEPARSAFAADSVRGKRKVPCKSRGGAPTLRRAHVGCFSKSTPLAQPYSSLYRPHERFRAELGK